MFGHHAQWGRWEAMLHGAAFVQYLHEDAPEHRGSRQGGSINWGMAMARRPVGDGRLGLRAMISLEPWTIAGCGYPDLLATGEVCDGDTIHDKQHPHDLSMELDADYDRPLAGAVRWQLYAGLSGEPALGPVAFPHRPSAMGNPIAPITHHWFDATHIVFGVMTAGVYGERWKVEGSAFNGREPDEERLDLDLGPLDSFSGRVTLLPTPRLALQVSAGALAEAEPPHGVGPRVDVERITVSAIYHRPVGGGRLWASAVGWGRNHESGAATTALLLETSLASGARDVWFGRIEVGEKTAEDLHVHESTDVFTIGKAQAGYTRYFGVRAGLQPGIGGTVSAALVPETLQPRYGGVGVGFGVFVTIRPAAHAMGQ
jgi:hypothetical protein